MKTFSLGASLLVATVAWTAPAGQPEFELTANPAGGHLNWQSHTYRWDGDRGFPNADYAIDHPDDGTLSVCLEWRIEPDPSSGDFLAASGAWRIPRQVLVAPRYVLAAERTSDETVVFTLAKPGDDPILKSPPVRILKWWSGDGRDHGHRLDTVLAADLEQEQRPPNQQADWAQPVANTTLGNCFRVSAELFRSDQPHAADLPALQALGIKSLLNLRQRHADDKRFERAGLVLLDEGMRAGDVSVEQLVRALRKFRTAPKPVLVHCWRGSDRTGFFVAGYRIICQGWPREAAIDEMRHGGFGYHASWYPNLVQCLAALDVETVKRRVFAPEEPSPAKPATAGAH